MIELLLCTNIYIYETNLTQRKTHTYTDSDDDADDEDEGRIENLINKSPFFCLLCK